MDKVWYRRVLNLLLYLSFCFIVGTGLLLEFKLVPGGQGGHGLTVLGMSRHEWGEWHFYVSLFFVLLVIIHLILSWGWLKRVAANKRLWPVILGLLAGLGMIAAIYFQPIEERNGKGRGRYSEVEH